MTTHKYSQHKVWNFDLNNLIREEELNGRHYIVVPMTMILEGVHTGSQGAVYYSIEELAKTPKQWNMKPIVIEHPFRGDTATDLEVYKRQAVGMIMNTHFIDGKLKAEAWIDKELAQTKCPELLMHIEHKLPMEISTGLFSELVLDDGVWQGEPYKGRIINIRADHLAILPRKQGACSLSDGAGLLINQKKDATDTLNIISTVINQEYPSGSLVVEDDPKTAQEIGVDLRAQPQEEPRGVVVEKRIEDKPQTQVLTTADGYKIIVEPPRNKTFKIEEPDFASADVVSEQKDVNEEVPLCDNSVIVQEGEQEEGYREFVESISQLNNEWMERYSRVVAKNANLYDESHKFGVRRENYNRSTVPNVFEGEGTTQDRVGTVGLYKDGPVVVEENKQFGGGRFDGSINTEDSRRRYSYQMAQRAYVVALKVALMNRFKGYNAPSGGQEGRKWGNEGKGAPSVYPEFADYITQQMKAYFESLHKSWVRSAKVRVNAQAKKGIHPGNPGYVDSVFFADDLLKKAMSYLPEFKAKEIAKEKAGVPLEERLKEAQNDVDSHKSDFGGTSVDSRQSGSSIVQALTKGSKGKEFFDEFHPDSSPKSGSPEQRAFYGELISKLGGVLRDYDDLHNPSRVNPKTGKVKYSRGENVEKVKYKGRIIPLVEHPLFLGASKGEVQKAIDFLKQIPSNGNSPIPNTVGELVSDVGLPDVAVTLANLSKAMDMIRKGHPASKPIKLAAALALCGFGGGVFLRDKAVSKMVDVGNRSVKTKAQK